MCDLWYRCICDTRVLCIYDTRVLRIYRTLMNIDVHTQYSVWNKKSSKNWRIAAAYETSCRLNTSIFKTIICDSYFDTEYL